MYEGKAYPILVSSLHAETAAMCQFENRGLQVLTLNGELLGRPIHK